MMARAAPRTVERHTQRGLAALVGLVVALAAVPAAAQEIPELAERVAAVNSALEQVRMAAEDAVAAKSARVLVPRRPEEPLGAWRYELPVPVVKQIGTKTNCGPTAAAMTIAAYEPEAGMERTRALRDVVGEWTWQAYPLRQMRLPGYDAGMTTRDMMRSSLERFGDDVKWRPVEHAWLPLEAWSVIALKQALAERRPVVVLAEARELWAMDAPGLHWVVVRGVEAGEVVFNDPADGAVAKVPLERFWTAWRLPDQYRSLPMVTGFEALVPDRSLPVVHRVHPELVPERMAPR